MFTRTILLTLLAANVGAASALATEPGDPTKALVKEDSPARSLTAIQRDVHAALRAEALSRRQGPNVPEVLALIELFRELAAHPQRDQSPMLAEMGLKVRARLADVCRQIERKGEATEQAAKRRAKVPTDLDSESHVLAQQLGPGGGAPGPGVQPGGGRAAGAPQSFDYGPELADIIRTVISPRTWDINGGPGAVVYYAPLRVLVVSAPDEVHPQVGNLLGQMRAAP